MMGREKKDPATKPKVGSSIILLQERFKQVQRLRETRKERQSTTGTRFSGFQDPLALGLNSGSAADTLCFQAIKPQQQFPSPSNSNSNFFEKLDVVDTSLRL